MEMFSAKLSGFAHCIVPQDSQILLQSQLQSIPLIPQILNHPMPMNSNQIPIVQIIIPAALTSNVVDEGKENEQNEVKPQISNSSDINNISYHTSEVISEHTISPLMSLLTGTLPTIEIVEQPELSDHGIDEDEKKDTEIKIHFDEKSSFTYNEPEPDDINDNELKNTIHSEKPVDQPDVNEFNSSDLQANLQL
jgi:hypothetical protein